MMLTAPTSAWVHSPLRRLLIARCRAVSDPEHMVSTHRLGPWRLKVYEMRLAIEANELLVTALVAFRF
ncbi:hypothetical protein D3C72_2242790 [compost metagenome]